jgi:hypothetical protein
MFPQSDSRIRHLFKRALEVAAFDAIATAPQWRLRFKFPH